MSRPRASKSSYWLARSARLNFSSAGSSGPANAALGDQQNRSRDRGRSQPWPHSQSPFELEPSGPRFSATTPRNASESVREVPQHRAATLRRMDERVLAERLITYDTSTVEGLRAAAGFIKGWLEARDIAVEDHQYGDVFALTAEVGPAGRARRSSSTATTTSCPARPEQFTPRIQGDRLEGRGAYDMKGGLAAMMCALHDLRDQEQRARALRLRARRGVRGDRPAHVGPAGQGRLRRRLRDHRRADRTCTSACRPRACWRCGSWSSAPPRTARRRGWATTRS